MIKLHSVALKHKVIAHFRNSVEHQHQGLFNGYNKVSLTGDLTLGYEETNHS